MSLRIYNTLTRQKELFEPVVPGKVGMYLCGPTVYKPPHIGHMVGPIIFDAIKRYLMYKGFTVTWVINITDVDDKLIDTAEKKNTTVSQLAEQYTQEYLSVLGGLGVDTVDHFPRATAYIGQIIDMCKTLIDKGHAYAAGGSVYFDVTHDADYGCLSRRSTADQEAAARETVGASEKRNPGDFALWKAAKPTESVSWESPWGKGRPGWHIECSAMSRAILGETFDIHGGGLDLMFPHHENEMAQSRCAHGKPQARFWLHNGLTRIRTKLASGQWADEKMSGSLGNVVSAQKLLEDHGPEVLRYLLLSTHYRSPIEFTDESIASAARGLSTFDRLRERVERLADKPISKRGPTIDQLATDLLASPDAQLAQNVLMLRNKFLESMDDDFNTAQAIATLHELASEINGYIERTGAEKQKLPQRIEALWVAAATLDSLGRLLGMFRFKKEPAADANNELASRLMALLIKLRNEAREAKNFATADAIRKGLDEAGILLEDRAGQTTWRSK